ncbi:MAG: hypothetical protein ABJA83_07475 [Burkholderiaceae bacterium]
MRVTGLLICASLAAACSPTFNWREFRSPEGYAVMLPGRPQTVVRDVSLPTAAVPMSMTSTGIGPTLFAVGSAHLPPALSSDAGVRLSTLGSWRDALVRNVNGSVVKLSPVRLTVPAGDSRRVLAAEAIEAVGSDSERRAVRLAARLFIVDDRLFQVVVLGGEGTLSPEILETFFTSFRLTE